MSRRLNGVVASMYGDLWKPPALAVAVCTATGLAWRRCLGVRRIGSNAKVDEQTAFALASGTKTMAVATIAQLCERGVITWDSRVADIDAGFDAGSADITREITLRDLACHRVGWTSSEGRHCAAAISRSDLVRRIQYQGFRHPFRGGFGYCTDGFSVLGHVVDLIAGEPWERYARTHLLAPLGMRRTYFSVGETRRSNNFATPHLLAPQGEYLAIPWCYEDGVATPAGGANSCLADLGAWLGAWLAGGHPRAPWSAEQQREMLEPQIANSGEFADLEFSCAVPQGENGITHKTYALGWYCHRYRGELVHHHTGSIRGFRSLIGLVPGRGVGVIALVNADAVFLARALFQAVLDDLQGSDPATWVDAFFDLETQHRETGRARYLTDPVLDHMPPELADFPGAYADDGRYGSTRITVGRHNTFAFEAGPLRYCLVPTDAECLRCLEPCGPLLIDQGSLRVRRDSSQSIWGFEFRQTLFKRV